MKTAIRILVFLVLLAVPAVGRGLWFYRGAYQAPQINPLDLQSIQLPVNQYQVFEDAPAAGNGRVVFDLSHGNNLGADDLTPLRERLAARQVTSAVFDGENDDFDVLLRRATAWVVAAPTTAYMPWEVAALRQFVTSGGKLLLAADPTRFAAFDPTGLSTTLSAYPAMNSLANGFDIQFYDDYLYDQAENAGNYRIVLYTHFAQGSPLTAGLELLALPAASSVQAQAMALVAGGADTHSNMRTSATQLTPVVLAGDGHILAMGDVTFLTPPFHTLEDNDHFLSNIADWLAQDERQRGLRDFPLLFNGPVSLVQLLGDTLDPYLIAQTGPLLDLFQREQIELALSPQSEAGGDILYLGTYQDVEAVQTLLNSAGVTLTLDVPGDESAAPVEEVPADEKQIATLTVDGLGQVLAAGSGLFITHQDKDGMKLVVLAADQEGALELLGRLIYADFGGCTSQPDVTVCAVGDAASGFNAQPEGQGGDGGPAAGRRILIIAFDNRAQGARTSAAQWESALSGSYDLSVWSIQNDGMPAADDLSGYDAYIIDSGDYAFSDADAEGFGAVSGIKGAVLFTGEQALPPQIFPDEAQPLDDLEVLDGAHPLADGFDAGQVIALSPSDSGVAALVASLESLSTGSQTVEVIFARGPQSPQAGSPVVLAGEEDGDRFILALFAFYRLPEDLQAQFALNAAAWLVGQ